MICCFWLGRSAFSGRLVVLGLERDGKLSIDSPVNTYLTRWKLTGPNAEKVTVKALLAHCGGVSVHGFRGYLPGSPIPNVIEVLSGSSTANSPKVEVVIDPWSEYRYLGGGVTALQEMVEDVTGESYEDYVRSSVLEPLGMINSDMNQMPTTPNLAFGHGPKGGVIKGNYRLHPEMAAAGLWSIPKDIAIALIAIGEAVARQPDALLPFHLAKAMTTPSIGISSLGTRCDGSGKISHGGSNRGFRCLYVFDIPMKTRIVVMSNGENAVPVIENLPGKIFQ